MAVERVDMGGYTLIENAPLGTRNTLRVDVRARLLAEIRDASKLPELLDFPAVGRGRLLVLGEGSNMLFTGDVDGTVLAMATRGVQARCIRSATPSPSSLACLWNLNHDAYATALPRRHR